MRLFNLLILSIALSTLFSGCSNKNIQIPDFSIPALNVTKKKLDRSLPFVTQIKATSTLSKVLLEWKPIRDRRIAGYRIFRNNRDGGFKLIKTINDPFVSHYTDKNLNQNIFYKYLISAYTKDGRVSEAKQIKIKKTHDKIKALSEVHAVSNLPSRIKLLWKVHKDYRVDGYIIQRRWKQEPAWKTITQLRDRLNVEYIDKDIIDGIRYQYRILATTKEGTFSRPSRSVEANSKRLPKEVSGIMATDNQPKKVQIIWKESRDRDIMYYKIYASSFADGLFSMIAKTRSTHYTDKFDRDGEVRYYKITAVDKDGLESKKQITPIRGSTLKPLKAPVILGYKGENGVITLKWKNMDKRTKSYTIYKKYWDKWRFKQQKIVGFGTETFIDKRIKIDKKYTYYVVAVDEYKIESRPSEKITVIVNSSPKYQNSWF